MKTIKAGDQVFRTTSELLLNLTFPKLRDTNNNNKNFFKNATKLLVIQKTHCIAKPGLQYDSGGEQRSRFPLRVCDTSPQDEPAVQTEHTRGNRRIVPTHRSIQRVPSVSLNPRIPHSASLIKEAHCYANRGPLLHNGCHVSAMKEH